MVNFSLNGVNKYKKLMISHEDYWEDELSVDFCIARRTRDILLGRNIVDNWVQSRRSAQKKFVLEFEFEAMIQEYFSSYVKDEAKLGDFWGIFINPSEHFAKKYSDFDEIWFPKLVKAEATEQITDELKTSFYDLLDLFRECRNTDYWENEEEWKWFFDQYLKFLTDKFSEQVCRDGLGIFISVIIKMHLIVESSGWKIDYNLYDEPLKVWGGQSLISKLRSRKTALSFAKRVKIKSSWPRGSTLGGRISNNMTNHIFTYFFFFFFGIFFSLAGSLFLDAIFSTIFFLIYGIWDSYLQKVMNHGILFLGELGQEIWKINSGFVGFDFLVNEFIGLQYSELGRWKMLGVSLLILILPFASAIIFKSDITGKSSNPKTPDDISIAAIFGQISCLAILAPFTIGSLIGIFALIFLE